MSEAEDPQNPKLRALFVLVRIGGGDGVILEAINGQAARAVEKHAQDIGESVEIYEVTMDINEVKARGRVVTGNVPTLEKGGMVVTLHGETRHFQNPYELAPVVIQPKPSSLNRKARKSLLSRLRRPKKGK